MLLGAASSAVNTTVREGTWKEHLAPGGKSPFFVVCEAASSATSATNHGEVPSTTTKQHSLGNAP